MDRERKRPKRPRSQGLDGEDLELWREVTRSVTPRVARPTAMSQQAHLRAAERQTGKAAAESDTPAPQPVRTRLQAGTGVSGKLPPLQQQTPPILNADGIDRRTRQRLQRGQLEVDVRLDLHGMRQAEAHQALIRFVREARARGARLALVITGKGQTPFARHTLHGRDLYETPERTAVLRTLVPRWLSEAPLREHVAAIQPAHPKHGGGGALYLWLRRVRKPVRE